MGRPLRIEYPGVKDHVTSRGDERKKIFRIEEEGESRRVVLFLSHQLSGWPLGEIGKFFGGLVLRQ